MNLPKFPFDHLEWDFGDISEGEKVEHFFTFANEGKNDLLIISAKGSCGCTVSDFPEKPVASGETSFVKVVFDTSGREGEQIKKIQVYANTEPAITELIIKANVKQI